MAQEAIYGKYNGVTFYGKHHLSFLYWCEQNNVEVHENKKECSGKADNGDHILKLKPPFYLPEFDLYVDIRAANEGTRYQRYRAGQKRASIAKQNPNFVYVNAGTMTVMDLSQARTLCLSDDPKVSVPHATRTALERFPLEEKKITSVGMPRWFRQKLKEIHTTKIVASIECENVTEA